MSFKSPPFQEFKCQIYNLYQLVYRTLHDTYNCSCLKIILCYIQICYNAYMDLLLMLRSAYLIVNTGITKEFNIEFIYWQYRWKRL